MFVKKHRDEWGKIVVTQLESVGAYTLATEKAIELNKQTDHYKALLNGSKEAQAALAAQQLLDSNKLLDAKAKELGAENGHLKAMQELFSANLTAMGLTTEETGLLTKRNELALQEKTILDAIVTETNPLKRRQLEEQAASQLAINGLVRDQNATELEMYNRKKVISALEESIRISKIMGRDVD
ncbi:MAG: hypothetical protein JZU65_05195, partial [Chlorobium sp.]|nr:hypothetical protein [Chlorobium sp.]